ncbi:hypothetical protein EZV62_017038 [Acer yangbiense]|uniref:Uncharacterized protein n=1 Tax=Acer yangbiense TaxID=1000413 RepID=A0A5C7HQW3_9ROSI|nr:hypothetical protein EZV62_017038 [Acer yangbiense]
MDAFSSSFISTLSPTTIIPKPILAPSSSRLNIPSVRIEDKPANQVTSTTTTPLSRLWSDQPGDSGVVKLDVSKGERQECIVATRLYGGACYGGEPIFVPKQPDNPEADEDDGYVVSFAHDEKCGESRFLVMDAKSAHLDIVAAVKLPRWVPYGFHGLFVRKNELDKL